MVNCEQNNLLRLFLQAGASCSFLKDVYSRRFRLGNKFGFIIEKVAERHETSCKKEAAVPNRKRNRCVTNLQLISLPSLHSGNSKSYETSVKRS